MTLITSANALCIKVYFVLLTLLLPGSWEEDSPRQSEVVTSKPKMAGERKIRLLPSEPPTLPELRKLKDPQFTALRGLE